MFAARGTLFTAVLPEGIFTPGQFMEVTTSGATVTTDGDFTVATFNDSGTFTVNSTGSDATYGSKVDYLVVAGGGGGGNSSAGGGGGAGGLLQGTGQAVTAQAYTITVGGGGAGGTPGVQGTNSSFGSIATSIGGGGGGSNTSNATSGGSGGGAGSVENSGPGSGASGTVGQGYSGGDSYGGKLSQTSGSGGGAGAAGLEAGNGGIGLASSISGVSTYYAGGGAGVAAFFGATDYYYQGGNGGGGGGQGSSGISGSNGTANTGGGGSGGSGPYSGGKGVVIIRWRFQDTPTGDIVPSNSWAAWNTGYDNWGNSGEPTYSDTITVTGIDTDIVLRIYLQSHSNNNIIRFYKNDVLIVSLDQDESNVFVSVSNGDILKFGFLNVEPIIDSSLISIYNHSDNGTQLVSSMNITWGD